MSEQQLMSRYDLELAIAARRNLLAQRANEMRRLLIEIIAVIDNGEYETKYAEKLLENVRSFSISREEITRGIEKLEGKCDVDRGIHGERGD